jgi:hypothetical protein
MMLQLTNIEFPCELLFQLLENFCSRPSCIIMQCMQRQTLCDKFLLVNCQAEFNATCCSTFIALLATALLWGSGWLWCVFSFLASVTRTVIGREQLLLTLVTSIFLTHCWDILLKKAVSVFCNVMDVCNDGGSVHGFNSVLIRVDLIVLCVKHLQNG